MNTLFYATGFIFIFLEFMTVITGNKTSREFIKNLKAKPNKKSKEYFKENKVITLHVIFFVIPFSFLYIIWTLLGLFTQQRFLFLAIILLSFVMQLFPNSELKTRVDANISLILLFFIINSHFNPTI